MAFTTMRCRCVCRWHVDKCRADICIVIWRGSVFDSIPFGRIHWEYVRGHICLPDNCNTHLEADTSNPRWFGFQFDCTNSTFVYCRRWVYLCNVQLVDRIPHRMDRLVAVVVVSVWLLWSLLVEVAADNPSTGSLQMLQYNHESRINVIVYNCGNIHRCSPWLTAIKAQQINTWARNFMAGVFFSNFNSLSGLCTRLRG